MAINANLVRQQTLFSVLNRFHCFLKFCLVEYAFFTMSSLRPDKSMFRGKPSGFKECITSIEMFSLVLRSKELQSFSYSSKDPNCSQQLLLRYGARIFEPKFRLNIGGKKTTAFKTFKLKGILFQFALPFRKV